MKKLLLPGLLICLLLNVYGQQIQPKKNASVEGITEYELPNGLRILLFPDQTKSTATVNITYLRIFHRSFLHMERVPTEPLGMTGQIILKRFLQQKKISIGHYLWKQIEL